MLIQGTNIPIKIVFDMSVETFPKLVATLWSGTKRVKKWEKSDMTVQGDTIYLPLEEDETRTYKRGKMTLNVKGLNSSNQTVFWQEATIEVGERKDKGEDLIS